MNATEIKPIEVKMPEELQTAYMVIIQRLMKRLGVMQVDLNDKDDPGDNERIDIRYNPRKGILSVTRVKA